MAFMDGDLESINVLLRASKERVRLTRQAEAELDQLLCSTIGVIRNSWGLILKTDKAIQKLNHVGNK